MTDTIIELPNNLIKIDFEIIDEGYSFRSAIVISKSLYDTWTQADIDAEKQLRWDNFIDSIKNPPDQDVPPLDPNQTIGDQING